MEILRSLDSFIPLESSVLTIGSYDGIHRGHQKVLSTVVEHSKLRKVPSVLVTFDPHPRYVLHHNAKELSLIMGIEQKLEIIESIGINIVYIINFTRKLSKTTAREFLETIIHSFFSPIYMIIGYNHHFGKNREGNAEFLLKYCKEKSIELDIIESVSDNEKSISSSRIRQLIIDGDIRKANLILGSVFSFKGVVVKGAGRGVGLNFPTANIIPVDNKQILPKIGVYFVRGRIIGHNAYGMCNLGVRPTFEENELIMEVHFFLDEVDNLYGKEVTIEFFERIRDEKKFPTSEKLVKQLQKDKHKCLSIKGKYE